jgi:hypothetical protein
MSRKKFRVHWYEDRDVGGAREPVFVVAEGVPGDWMFKSRNAWQNFYWYAELATKERIATADAEFRAKQQSEI